MADIKAHPLYPFTAIRSVIGRGADVVRMGIATGALVCVIARPGLAQDARPPGASAHRPAAGLSEAVEEGLPYLRHFSPLEYGAPNQNFQVIQDEHGLIYAANRSGVLEFDGERWRLIPSPDDRTTWRVAPVPGGTLLVGGDRMIGIVERTGTATPRIRILSDDLPEDSRPTEDVRIAESLDSTVYLASPSRLYRWTPSTGLSVWGPSGTYRFAWSDGRQLYVHDSERGMLVVVGESLELIPGGDAFAGKRVFAMATSPDGMLVVGAADDGLYRSDGARFQRIRSFSDVLEPEERPFHGLGLSDGTLAIGTNRGLVLLDSDGYLIRRLDRTTGLQNELINRIFIDRQAGMWLALQNGIARLEVPAPLTHFDKLELQGAEAIIRHQGRLFVSVRVGVLQLVPDPATGTMRFTPVRGMMTECYGLLSTPQGLLAACEAGVYSIVNGIGTRINSAVAAVTLTRSVRDSSYVFVGESSGVALLRLRAGRWVDAGKVSGTDGFVRHLEEDDEGRVLFATRLSGIRRLEFERGYASTARSTSIDSTFGMPAGRLRVFRTGGRLLFATPEGLRRFDSMGRLVPDTTFGPSLATGEQVVSRLVEGPDGSVWMVTDVGLGVARPNPVGGFEWRARAVNGMPRSEIYAVYPEPRGITWAGGSDELFRYDAKLEVVDSSSFATLIRRVSVISGDSTLSYGWNGPETLPAVRYKENALRFEYAAARYDVLEGHGYQTRLDGLESEWSPWTISSEHSYDRLTEGNYTFHVRARDRSGRIGAEASFGFSVLPPWYRSWWAYLVYLSIFGGVVFVVDRVQRMKLSAAENARGQVREIQLRAELAEERSRSLHELTELRSRFFSDVSHEFRTPLTLVMGPLNDLVDHPALANEEDVREDLELALRNVRRLNRLVNELLDSARLEAKQVVLDRRRVNMCAFVEQVTSAFEGLAKETDKILRVSTSERGLPVQIDVNQFEKVILNLLSNAFKFTPPGGRVSVAVERHGNGDGRVRIVVFNSGSSISDHDIDHLFERFYQTDSARNVSQVGSGIGLNMVRDITRLHGGEVDVFSDVEGVTFVVTVPLADEESELSETYDGPQTDARSVIEELLETGTGVTAPDGSRATGSAEVATGAEGTDDEAGRPVVLVVDDNANIRSLVRRRLEPMYRVREAADGKEGLASVHRFLPDLVISDVMMPVMDGYAFCTAMKADPETAFIPVLMLTARAAQSDRIAGWDTGADAYLAKPFDDRELMSVIINLLAAAHRLRDRLLSGIVAVSAPVERPASTPLEKRRERLMGILREGIPDDGYGVDQIADRLGTSRASLYREFADVFNDSPAQILKVARLEQAAALLANGAGSVGEICYASGFRNVAHFSKSFRDHFHRTPTQYAKDHAGEPPV